MPSTATPESSDVRSQPRSGPPDYKSFTAKSGATSSRGFTETRRWPPIVTEPPP
jgi:hypothetical protein